MTCGFKKDCKLVHDFVGKPIRKWKVGNSDQIFCAVRAKMFKEKHNGNSGTPECPEGYISCFNNICVGKNDECPLNKVEK